MNPLHRIGVPCKTCGSTVRYKITRNCVACAKVASIAATKKIRAARRAQGLTIYGDPAKRRSMPRSAVNSLLGNWGAQS